MWQVPGQPDKENIREIVKAFVISEKKRSVSSTMESRIAALESVNLMEFSRTPVEEKGSSNQAKKVCNVYSFADILKATGRPHQDDYGSVNLKFESRGHSGMVSSLSFNSSGNFVASGCTDGIINIWSLQVISEAFILTYNMVLLSK